MKFKVEALKEYYGGLVTASQKKLEKADHIGFTVIPRIALTFVGGYFALGLLKYYEYI